MCVSSMLDIIYNSRNLYEVLDLVTMKATGQSTTVEIYMRF